MRSSYQWLVRIPVGWQALICLLIVSCAKIADPRPPDRPIPPRPQPPEVIQIGDQRVLLRTQLPPAIIQKLLVLRACPSTDPLRDYSEVEIGAAELASGFVEYEDPSRIPIGDCAYAVRFESRGRRSESSPPVSTAEEPVALPPSNLRYQQTAEVIRLEWDPPLENIDGTRPARIEGYLINSQIEVEQTSFDDRSFEFEQPKSYQVQTISRTGNPLILSELSETLTVSPRDVFPPAKPAGVSAAWVGQRVQLVWEPNEESDLAGYYLYRGTDPLRLERASELIAINRHADLPPSGAEELYYQVTAVDIYGNESEASDTVAVARSRP